MKKNDRTIQVAIVLPRDLDSLVGDVARRKAESKGSYWRRAVLRQLEEDGIVYAPSPRAA